MVKNLPAKQEARVESWGREDPLEKGKATDSSVLAWRIPWTNEPGGLHVFVLPQTPSHQGCHLTLLLPLLNCKELPFALWVPIPRPCRDHRPHKHALITFTEREKRIGKGKQRKVTHAKRKGLSLCPRILSSFPIPLLMQNDEFQVGLCHAGAKQFSPSYQTSTNLFPYLEKVRCREPGL